MELKLFVILTINDQFSLNFIKANLGQLLIPDSYNYVMIM